MPELKIDAVQANLVHQGRLKLDPFEQRLDVFQCTEQIAGILGELGDCVRCADDVLVQLSEILSPRDTLSSQTEQASDA
jgi:hypothetical protein